MGVLLEQVGRLVLSAWGNDVDESRLMVRDLGLSDVTTLLPPQRRGELIRLYHQADAVVSHFVGRGMGVHHFTMVSFEAMACGVPVISSMNDDMYMRGFGSTPPMLEASTPREIADHLLALYRDESLRTQLGQLGRQWALDHHRPELIAPKLIDIYERALEGGG